MKKRIMCAVIASAMIAAASMSAVVYADDTQAAASESTAKLTRGVWAAYTDKEGDGKYDDIADYYVFTSETEGHTSSPDLGIGLPFAVEQNGAEALFHFASADDNTKAEIKDVEDGSLDITFTYDSGDKKTYRLVFLPGEDPDTFSGDEVEYAADAAETKITKGVWAAYGGDTISDYYIFDSETQGHTAKPENGLGLPFSVEQVGDGSAVFHFASADNNTPAEIAYVDKGVFNVTLTGEDGESVTYRFELLPDEDPDTFMNDAAEALLAPGVYAAFISPEKNEVYDMLDTYFVFTSETEGYTNSPIMGIGLPFSVEQNGTNAVFHMASADDNTPAAILPIGDGSYLLTLNYSDGSSTIYRLVKTENADTKNFNGASSYYGVFETTDEGIQLYNANGEFKFLLGTPRADETGLEINYAMPLLEGFDIDFIFTTADKNFATYNVSYNGTIDNDTIFFDLEDLLKGAGIDGENVASFTVKNNGNGTIVQLGFLTERHNSAKINLVSDTADSDANEQNPATGANDIFAAGALAAVAGLTVLASRKRK